MSDHPNRRTRRPRTTRRGLRLTALAAVAVSAFGLGVQPAAALPAYPNTDTFTWFGNYRIDEVWRAGATGQGITVAVLDSGVDPGRELSGVVLPGTDLAGGDGRTDTDTPRGHGTAMARFIAAQGGGPNGLTGIAPDAKILPVTVDPGRRGATADTFTRGITWAAEHGADVINISQGAAGSCPGTVQDAITAAVRRGSIVVASSGNTGNTTNEADFPADCKGVLAVGAVYGDRRPWPKSQRQSYVDVAAPGVDMQDENLAGEVGKSSGTSNSTALVSASAALVWSKFPKLTNRQVVARLLATVSDDSARPGRDDVTGYGIVVPYKAITQKVAANAPNPVFDQLPAATSTPSGGSGSSGSSVAPSGPSSSTAPLADDESGSSDTVWIVGGIVVALLAVVGVAVLVARSRNRPGPPPGGMYGPPGAAGGWHT